MRALIHLFTVVILANYAKVASADHENEPECDWSSYKRAVENMDDAERRFYQKRKIDFDGLKQNLLTIRDDDRELTCSEAQLEAIRSISFINWKWQDLPNTLQTAKVCVQKLARDCLPIAVNKIEDNLDQDKMNEINKILTDEFMEQYANYFGEKEIGEHLCHDNKYVYMLTEDMTKCLARSILSMDGLDRKTFKRSGWKKSIKIVSDRVYKMALYFVDHLKPWFDIIHALSESINFEEPRMKNLRPKQLDIIRKYKICENIIDRLPASLIVELENRINNRRRVIGFFSW